MSRGLSNTPEPSFEELRQKHQEMSRQMSQRLIATLGPGISKSVTRRNDDVPRFLDMLDRFEASSARSGKKSKRQLMSPR